MEATQTFCVHYLTQPHDMNTTHFRSSDNRDTPCAQTSGTHSIPITKLAYATEFKLSPHRSLPAVPMQSSRPC